MFVKFETTGIGMEVHVAVEWRKLGAALRAAGVVIAIGAALYSSPPIQHLMAYLGF